jgi:PPOX class probable F420-dependent enzyme
MIDEDIAAPPQSHRDILEGKGFAHVATVGPDGAPTCNPVWYEWDGARLRFSTTKSRRKYRNLSRSNKVAVSICDFDNPYRQIELRGSARLRDDPEAVLIHRLSERYTGRRFDGELAGRVIVEVTPLHFTTHS